MNIPALHPLVGIELGSFSWPDTAAGWTMLLFAGSVPLMIFYRGLASVAGSMEKYFKGSVLFTFVLVVAVCVVALQ